MSEESGQWFVIQVLSGHEKKVKRALDEGVRSHSMEEFVKEIVVPEENVVEIKAGEQKIREKRLWPGYALVRMVLTDESWQFIKTTNGVIDFLGKGKPVPLSQKEVEQILNDLKQKKGEVVHKHDIKIGDSVKIVDGVFINFIGSVTNVNHEKGSLSVMVSIFGRDTKVEDLEFWQVEEVPHDAEVE
ncbi:transcription termination/antitermination protein NusG [Candidatus Aerophobetes bacterium]|uniref:Transcription termination/antitermination protein NusG n=1 Tax=Aerophobetes bacterium TaxID=2030807 RepID=A0A2A4X709_UNCAE|nr:MAG: transcription termination/antitermination protein NusG [Candidatus Aerophobetes bacterium]